MPYSLTSPLRRPLVTPRLSLRPYSLADAPAYFEIAQRNRDHLSVHESGNVIFDIHCEADAVRVLRGFGTMWETRAGFPLGVFLRETHDFVGQVLLLETNAALPAYNLGFFGDCAQLNHGYVTEAARAALHFAFHELHAHRVGVWCDDRNVRSRRVAERCGFVREGHAREDKRHPDGSVSGSMCYGLLRDEFLANPSDDPARH